MAEQSLSEKWDAKAGEWTAWARSPTHDVFFSGFVIEQLREPRAIDREPPDPLARAVRRPYFLHMRCRLEHSAGPLPSQLR